MTETLFAGRYRILGTLGRGGFAVVYRAFDTVLQRAVAIKVLRNDRLQDPALRQRLEAEARLLANLSHPNLVTIYDFGWEGGQPYFVMEYVDGWDLKTLIRHAAPLTVERALELFLQICAGVGHAHRNSIVHGDLKPQNILVSRTGEVKVVDFGIAATLWSRDPDRTTWATPQYLSPEQAAGHPPTPASDVYSLGLILYEMLTGRLPFEASTPTELLRAHLTQAPPSPKTFQPGLPDDVVEILLTCLEKEPARRYRNADQLARVLLQRHPLAAPTGLAEQPTGPTTPAVPTPVPSVSPAAPAIPEERDWLVWLLGALAALAVLGLIPLWWLVYRAWLGGPTGVPTPTPPPTVVPAIQVPDLRGLPVVEAQARAMGLGLGLSVAREVEDPQQPAGVVIAQEPPPGATLQPGEAIQVTVNRGAPVFPVINVLGYTLDENILNGLRSYGWDVRVERVWSPEPAGRILEQRPPPGALLGVGQPLTLTVSAGTRIEIGANFANWVTLDAVDLPQRAFRPGETIVATLEWRALQRVDQPLVIFVHLIAPNGQLIAQRDAQPNPPIPAWQPGQIVRDPLVLPIPAGAPPGTYQLRTGLYPEGNPAARVVVLTPGYSSAVNNSVLISELTLRP
ncbi:MAG: protein kinase [Thermoflexus sp.]|uniref:protein kinase domain-containing protein n=1 Tax=Thermoflexus sp. TaxID=1969742 RepID=UPI0025E2E469|nr:protein kinase [Thermoflexus sp.]MCS6964434.1 protein kinase [Thermoflexus sp.]MDW8185935.1 protein kinase [Anaerolineae bacterium]